MFTPSQGPVAELFVRYDWGIPYVLAVITMDGRCSAKLRFTYLLAQIVELFRDLLLSPIS